MEFKEGNLIKVVYLDTISGKESSFLAIFHHQEGTKLFLTHFNSRSMLYYDTNPETKNLRKVLSTEWLSETAQAVSGFRSPDGTIYDRYTGEKI